MKNEYRESLELFEELAGEYYDLIRKYPKVPDESVIEFTSYYFKMRNRYLQILASEHRDELLNIAADIVPTIIESYRQRHGRKALVTHRNHGIDGYLPDVLPEYTGEQLSLKDVIAMAEAVDGVSRAEK